ncbi:hypothetical protein Asfd1_141 [Aeromonas phage Asfd_1]|nr:hypothetical protein Asfd1_141 [Aeromonas phage Asfd_1]
MDTAGKLFRFVTNANQIFTFTNSSQVNTKIYNNLKDMTFMLKLTASSSVHYMAVNSYGERISREFDYDFNEKEVELVLEVVSHAEPVNTMSLVEWVKAHNHGDLPFDKVVAMYNIAKGE